MDYGYLGEKPKTKKKRVQEVILFLVEILLVIVAAYLIIAFGVERTTMIGESMEPTLSDQNKIIINKMAYRFTGPKRFDVVVFKPQGKEHSYYSIKRVIGLPGETIQILNGQVYINDELLEEKFVFPSIVNEGLAVEAITLDENEYFVLGDNRNNSEDSRYANVGNVTRQEIAGKAWIRLHPFNFINLLGEKSKEQ
jgi:signal peptidase I